MWRKSKKALFFGNPYAGNIIWATHVQETYGKQWFLVTQVQETYIKTLVVGNPCAGSLKKTLVFGYPCAGDLEKMCTCWQPVSRKPNKNTCFWFVHTHHSGYFCDLKAAAARGVCKSLSTALPKAGPQYVDRGSLGTTLIDMLIFFNNCDACH